MPLTFSAILNPLDGERQLLEELNKLPNTKPVFCRVEGDDPSIFKRIVAYMARAELGKQINIKKKNLI